MSKESQRILKMLESGKITVDEADRLLRALGEADAAPGPAPASRSPKYLRVVVEEGGERGTRVNVRVPVALIRAGMKFESLIPEHARHHIDAKLADKGIHFNLAKLRGKDMDDLIAALQELAVDVEGSDGEKVRVFCE
jgi:hypothetical protein